MNHPKIIKLYEILHNYQKEKIYLILEFAEYGDIIDINEEKGIFSINKHVSEAYSKIKNKKKFNNNNFFEEEDLREFCKDILLGIDYLHKNGIIHHDIKPNNILLCKNGTCKLTDFNFSSILENLSEDDIGQNVDCANHFRSPETISSIEENTKEDKQTSIKSFQGKPLDIWALGVTLYIMTYLRFPFDSEKSIVDLYHKIKEAKIEFPIEPFYSRKLKYLIQKCLEKDPSKRKTADEILRICILHKFESLDKYKPAFVKKNYEVEVTTEELCQTLDFFHNECNAVFENPNDLTKPIVVRYTKKLVKFSLPEGRSLVKVILPKIVKEIKYNPPMINKSKEQKEEELEKNMTLIHHESQFPKNIGLWNNIVVQTYKIYEKEENENNRNQIFVERKIEINDENNGDKKILIYNDDDELGTIEGKMALQKYIDEK